MAYGNRGSNLPGIVAGADLTAAQHRFITIDSTGRAVLSGLGGRISAVLQNNPNTGQAATLEGPGSVSKLESGAAVGLLAENRTLRETPSAERSNRSGAYANPAGRL